MSCWATLGVEPYSDLRTIKRAYARLLKDMHPEERPAEFMALREAYERASVMSAREAARTGPREPEPGPAPAEQLEAAAASPDVHEPDPALLEALRVQREQEQEEADARQRFNLRMQALADAFIEVLDDPQRRADPAIWQALLSTPELSNLDIRLRHGANLLPAVIDLLEAPEQSLLPPGVLVLLDDSFHWTQDQNINWPASEESMQRLCLLVGAAHRSIASAPPRTGWGWFFSSMFRPDGRLSRTEFSTGMTLLLPAAFLVAFAMAILLPQQLRDAVIIVIWLVAVYAVVIALIKRIRDSGTNIYIALVLGIAFPVMNLLYIFANSRDPVSTPGNPRARFVDPYVMAAHSLFRSGFRYGIQQRVRRFFLSMKPSLAWSLILLPVAVAGLLTVATLLGAKFF